MNTITATLYSENSEIDSKVCYDSIIDDSGKLIVKNCIVIMEEDFESGDLYADVQIAIAVNEGREVNEVSIPCEIIVEVKQTEPVVFELVLNQ